MSFKFGTNPPRSLNSFGVSGLLDESCTVFYQSVFGPKHIGKISDLLSARLLESGINELQFRNILVHTLFESYRSTLSKEEWVTSTKENLSEPLVIECGVDVEKVVVGISFTYPESDFINLTGLNDRLDENKPENEFERLLSDLDRSGDRLVIKVQPAIRRIEIASLLGLPEKMDLENDSDSSKVQLVVIDTDPDEVPAANKYVELGDIDYQKLLSNDVKMKGKKKKSQGAALAQIAKDAVEDEDGGLEESTALSDSISSKVKGSDDEKDGSQKVSGGEDEKDGSTTVKGSSEEEDDSVTVVGGGDGEADDEAILVKENVQESNSPDKFEAREKHYKQQIEELQKKITLLENQLDKQSDYVVKEDEEEEEEVTRIAGDKEEKEKVTIVKGSQPKDEDEEDEEEEESSEDEEEENEDEEEEEDEEEGDEDEEDEDEDDDEDEEDEEDEEDAEPKSKKIKNALGKIWPFKKKKKKTKKKVVVRAPVEEEEGEEAETSVEDSFDNEEAREILGGEKYDSSLSDPKSYAQDLMLSVSGGNFDQAINKMQNEGKSLVKDAKSPKMKMWVDNIAGQLLAEKSRMMELSKKLNQSVRQKELDFRNKERALHEEIRKKDNEIKQKNNSLARTKDQLLQVTMNMERLKSSAQGAAADGLYKKKLDHARVMLDSQKEENTTLKKKIDELKDQLMTAKTHGTTGPSQVDLDAMKDRYDRVRKQSEELKRQVADLQGKLNKLENPEELDKLQDKLERAMKIAVDANKEMESQKEQIKAFEAENEELKQKVVDLKNRKIKVKKKKKGKKSSAA